MLFIHSGKHADSFFSFFAVSTKRCHHPLSPEACLHASHFFWWPGKSWVSFSLLISAPGASLTISLNHQPLRASLLIQICIPAQSFFSMKLPSLQKFLCQVFEQTANWALVSFYDRATLIAAYIFLPTFSGKGRSGVVLSVDCHKKPTQLSRIYYLHECTRKSEVGWTCSYFWGDLFQVEKTTDQLIMLSHTRRRVFNQTRCLWHWA